jgi:diguanylate cyclase (GGDEF)-like protein
MDVGPAASGGVCGLTTEVEACVARDKADILYSHGRGGLAATVVASTALGFMAAEPDLEETSLLWTTAALSVVAVRAVDVLWLRRRRRGRVEGLGEIRRFGAGVLASASLWAAFPLLFFPSLSPETRAATAIVLGAMAGGASTVLAPSLSIVVLYCTALLAPASVAFLLLGGRLNLFLGVLGLAMLATLIESARVANRSLTSSFRFSRLNEALVAQAERQRRETEVMNRDLADVQQALAEINQSLEDRIEQRTADLTREIAERKRFAEALATMASTDPLTGLQNRTKFQERVARLLGEAEANGTELAVLFLDLDDFKQVNDARGHAVGDQVLQATATALRRGCEIADIARWGGDEFVLAVPLAASHSDIYTLAEWLRQLLSAPRPTESGPIRIGVTIGIASFPYDGNTPDELIRAADLAMYHAKKEGKGRIKLFDPALTHAVVARHRLEQAMHGAIGRGEMRLSFHPIIDARTGHCLAMEALLRWRHPELGPVSPDTFIGIAEHTGEIVPIGRWVLREACRAARSWGEKGPAVSVNVSILQILDGAFLADVADALDVSGLVPERLELEITETRFMTNQDIITPVFAELRRRGHRVLMDDFGTGYSALTCLGQIPLDGIKIDREVIGRAAREDDSVITAILSLARAFSLQVTAEGVELNRQVGALAAAGVDSLQGMLIADPLDASEVTAWLRRFDGAALMRGAPTHPALGARFRALAVAGAAVS